MAIIINKPYIEKLQNGKVRLCSKIEGSMNDVLYYEVDEKYEQYLCDDRADAFVVGLLHSAMYNGEDIVCNCGVSERLLFQLNTYYISAVSDNMPDLENICIQAQPLEELEGGKAVGTGNSGGVDSIYTMLKYTREHFGNLGLTHVLFNNVSSNDDDETRIRTLFNRDIKEKQVVAAKLGYEFIAMFTNLYQFYKSIYIFNHYFALQYASAAYALKKLFGVFYFSSTFQVNMFSIDHKKIVSSARYDIFTLDCASSKNLKFYSAGMEVDRMGKMRAIAGDTITQNHLQVCAIEQSQGGYQIGDKLNCGFCHKCSRTIAVFYAWGMLDKYEGIYDLTQFHANRNKFIGKGLAMDQGTFTKMVKQELRKSKLYTIRMELWYILYSIRYGLAKNRKLVQIYHSLKGKGK